MKTRIAALCAALASIVGIGALVAPAASADTANRGAAPIGVTVALTGTGTGTVTSTGNTMGDPQINCPGTCSASFQANSSVTLTATPAAGSIFAGYSGGNVNAGCTASTNPCTFNIGTSPNNVTATFNVAPPVDPPSNAACDKATTKLAKAKEKLAALKASDASDKKIAKAKKKVKKAKKAKRKACASK